MIDFTIYTGVILQGIAIIFFASLILRTFKHIKSQTGLLEIKINLMEKKLLDEMILIESRLASQFNREMLNITERQWKMREDIILLDHKTTPVSTTTPFARPRGRPPKQQSF
jgi:hypothetical protein